MMTQQGTETMQPLQTHPVVGQSRAGSFLKVQRMTVIFRINRHFSLCNLRFTVFKLKKESNR